MENSKSLGTPMHPTCKLSKGEHRISVDLKQYRGMIGALIHLTASRPYILFSIYIGIRF